MSEPNHVAVLRGWLKDDHETAVMALVEDASFRQWVGMLLTERDQMAEGLRRIMARVEARGPDDGEYHDIARTALRPVIER